MKLYMTSKRSLLSENKYGFGSIPVTRALCHVAAESVDVHSRTVTLVTVLFATALGGHCHRRVAASTMSTPGPISSPRTTISRKLRPARISRALLYH